jgi:hypothetical protein
MNLDKKILSEIDRYRSINRYIIEQAGNVPTPEDDLGPLSPLPGDAGVPPPSDAAAIPPAAPVSVPLDVENDPDVEKIDDEGNSQEKNSKEDSGSEELDITELVDSQKNIETKQNEYFDNLFGQLNNLQSKLGEMDNIMGKLNSIEDKIEKYREKTPQEKLELRTYDSYPFNQKLSQFFDDKSEEMEKTGKNDYILTTDDVKDINFTDVKKSFQPNGNYERDTYKNSFK